MPQRIAGFLVDVGSEMVLSILPLFMAGLNISKTWIGIIEGIAETASTALKAVSGWVSERVEKQKPLIVIGYTLSTVVKPFLALSNFWYQVLSVRFFDRIGRGERTVSRSGMVCGALLSSLLLFVFAGYFKMDALSQYRNIFWLSVIPAILGMLTASAFMKEARKKIGGKEKQKELSLSLGKRLKLFFFVLALYCKLVAMSTEPTTSAAFALSPTTISALNLPSFTNGEG